MLNLVLTALLAVGGPDLIFFCCSEKRWPTLGVHPDTATVTVFIKAYDSNRKDVTFLDCLISTFSVTDKISRYNNTFLISVPPSSLPDLNLSAFSQPKTA